MLNKELLARVIDSAVLHADATASEIKTACADAKKYKLYGLDVNLSNAELAKKFLKNTQTKLIVVAGYPLGATSAETKMFETLQAVRAGADEIDMVMNIGAFKSKDFDVVKKDIKGVVHAAKGLPVKAIIETGLLSHNEIAIASKIVAESGAMFVKTCSGYGPRGVSITDIKIIRNSVGKDFGIKAAGGITTAQHALALLNAGATRIGTSHAKNLIDTI